MNKLFEVGDVVRIDNKKKRTESSVGLFEVTGYDANGFISLTKDEADSEFYTNQSYLILVCKYSDRLDI